MTIGGQAAIAYHAFTGTLVVHPKGWDDVSQRRRPGSREGEGEDGKPAPKAAKAEASMFYAAYFKDGAPSATRPHHVPLQRRPRVVHDVAAHGRLRPEARRDGRRRPAPPRGTVPAGEQRSGACSTRPTSYFIDAPGAGFSRIAGPDKEHSFYGVDADAYAFAELITQLLGKYGRWNSPKYLFGESYGTTRCAVLVAELALERGIDVNGVIMLSQFLNAGLDETSPGVDLPFELALPTYAATAWYHHKLGPDVPADLKALVAEVERFALTEYARAPQQGNALPEAERAAIAQKLHTYTGLPIDYIRKARLRVTKEMFEKALHDAADVTTGRLDTRFSAPAMDPLAKEPDYDPFSAAVGSAYVSAFNDYVRKELKFGDGRTFRLFADTRHWSWEHHGFGGHAWTGGLNVMGDLAAAMKYNPNLHVQLEAGYFDLATPFFQGTYELMHLSVPDRLQANIETRRYESGHMIYAVEAQLHALHDNVADFIRRTSAPRRSKPSALSRRVARSAPPARSARRPSPSGARRPPCARGRRSAAPGR